MATHTTPRLAARFLAAGGRFTIDPAGRIDFGINMRRILALDTPETERRNLLRQTRAASRLVDRRRDQLAALINEKGQPVAGWSVWGEC